MSVTVTSIQRDFAQTLTRVNDRHVRDGVRIPALWDTREVLMRIERLANVGRLECLQETLDTIGALAIAARLAHASAEMLDITAGGEAA